MPQPNDLSRSLVALDQNSTIIVVIEMSQSSWLVGGVLPGIERQPRKKLEPNPERLLALLHRWRDEAVRAGRTITRIAVAFEAGRDGFWLARWLEARGVEVHVIHPSSVAVSREHRRAKTDRLDTELLKRGFLGWLRGERGHCSMARVPTIAEEDAKRPNRERDCLVGERTRIVNRIKSTLTRLGIRNFKPTLRKAAERLATVHTPEGMPLQLGQGVWRRRHAPRGMHGCRPLGGLAQGWFEVPNAQPGQGGLYPVHNPRAFPDQAVALAVRPLGVLFGNRGHARHAAMAPFATQPPQEPALQQLGVEPVGFRAAMLPRYRDTRGMDHVRLYSTRRKPARQPEAVAASFEGQRNPRDRAAGPDRLIPPAMQQAKQSFRARFELLAR